MTVHQFDPQRQHRMPLGWSQKLASASNEHEIVDVARDFAAQFTPYELATLPEHCRPGRIHDANDVTEYAFALVRHRCDDGEGTTYVVHRLADFFSYAALRLSQILRAKSEHVMDEDRQSA